MGSNLASFEKSSINLLLATVGAGILSLPSCVRDVGFIYAFVLIVGGAATGLFINYLLVFTKDIADKSISDYTSW